MRNSRVVNVNPDLDPDSQSESGSRRAKRIHKNKKVNKFHFLKCWMFSFEG
jgi:hypothetical protein